MYYVCGAKVQNFIEPTKLVKIRTEIIGWRIEKFFNFKASIIEVIIL